MRALNPLLRFVLVCRLANSPVADVAGVFGVPDDENELVDAADELEADIVEDVDVVVDVDEDKIEADVIGDTCVGVGVDEFVTIFAINVDHVIGERSDLRLFSRSEYGHRVDILNFHAKTCYGGEISEEDELLANKKIPAI